jgi:hypothetical protein
MWWAASRWWRSQSDPDQVPSPATPWPPVPTSDGSAPVPVSASGPTSVVTPPPGSAVVAGRAPAEADDRDAWVLPVDGACPAGYPVKAKLRSRIYHLPGMAAYSRTIPDRCYRAADDAEADGFVRAKH